MGKNLKGKECGKEIGWQMHNMKISMEWSSLMQI